MGGKGLEDGREDHPPDNSLWGLDVVGMGKSGELLSRGAKRPFLGMLLRPSGMQRVKTMEMGEKREVDMSCIITADS